MVRSLSGKRPEYYEAILQLRDVRPEVEEFVQQNIRSAGVRIAKVVKERKGMDLYLSDKNFTRNLGRKLQQEFGGYCLVTASLFGRKEGQEIYRLTVLFRGLPFRKGEEVRYKGEAYQAVVLGRKMVLQSLETGKKVQVKYKDVGLIKVA